MESVLADINNFAAQHRATETSKQISQLPDTGVYRSGLADFRGEIAVLQRGHHHRRCIGIDSNLALKTSGKYCSAANELRTQFDSSDLAIDGRHRCRLRNGCSE